MGDENEKLAKLLSHIELVESKLLGWGVVDGSFMHDELCEEIERRQADCDLDEDPTELLNRLIELGWVFEFNHDGIPRYRSRMAETVRLLARMRQIRPWNNWQTAPTLVADFRFRASPRRYPSRDVSAAETIGRVEHEVTLSSTGKAALRSMLRLDEDRPLTLAEFQARATVQVLADLNTHRSRGVIVTAGTGTGKTKAFYLPALTSVAQLVSADAFWVKVLALYPRNELLKDQYSETYREVLLINQRLCGRLPRRISIGVLFGDTPKRARIEQLRSWQSGGLYRCSSLRCPQCDSELHWALTDIQQSKEVLSCTNRECGFRSIEGDLLLTRDSLLNRPPDVLFSTTEMLNQRMSDRRYARLFGIGTAQPPRIVLLDEVHTYHGTHGAQVAYLLRRWRYGVRRNVQFTGLSATLENATDFFAQLTGLRPSAVVNVHGQETVARGTEYQLALRGDPVSAAALLSTTIQTSMLLRRVLDRSDGRDSPSVFGRRAYVFTDDLDVVNRLYYDLRDAEGHGRTGRSQVLAAFREHARPQARERLLFGQSWKLCEDLGHTLRRGLVIGRTTSQDSGVDRNADVVVATASLEVGYNDPTVGAVVQHKAPRDMANFLQRKGRAGRRPEMRPWTIVTLSDYGRDRFTYESYDQLFSPKLSARILPTGNRYILRMQAAYALMDWLSQKLPEKPAGSVWRDLVGPADPDWTSRQVHLARILQQAVEQADVRNELEAYLKMALSISREEVLALMWEPPRSIMMDLIPTILRRLESGWHRVPVEAGDSSADLSADNAPLPDFVPGKLFSDLSLPEVEVVPERNGETGHLPVLQAIQTMSPGNVTRRFAPHHNASHWIAPSSLTDLQQTMEIASWCSQYEHLGSFQMARDGAVVDIPCIRPLQFKPAITPANVRETSKGFLDWRNQIFAGGGGSRHRPPANSPWARIIDNLEFFTHASNTFVTVRRFAIGATANVTFSRSQDNQRTFSISFRHGCGDAPAGVGFTQDVDGIAVRFRYPADLRVGADDPDQDKIRSLRTAYFRHRVLNDRTLRQHANDFQLDWLCQMYLSALSSKALEDRTSLPEAHTELTRRGLGPVMISVLEAIFQTIQIEEDSEQEESKAEQKTKKRLEALTSIPEVVARIAALAPILWDTPDEQWYQWARERFRATLGNALLEAMHRCSSQVDIDGLWVDLDPGPAPDGTLPDRELNEIWITERTLGGTGIIEEIWRRYSEDPLRFFRLVEHALGANDLELVDAELSRLAQRSLEPKLRDALNEVRNAVGNDELLGRVTHLRRILQSEGFVTSHSVMAAIQARILRPGTDEAFDDELRDILASWRSEEERLGIEIDVRVIAYTFSRHRRLSQALPFLPEVNLDDPQWRYQAYCSILWPRGNVVRRRDVPWQPFSKTPPIDRFLVLDCLEESRTLIDVLDPEWIGAARGQLADTAVATLTCPADSAGRMQQAILQLVSAPFEVGFLHVYPQIEGACRRGDNLEVRVVCREAIR